MNRQDAEALSLSIRAAVMLGSLDKLVGMLMRLDPVGINRENDRPITAGDGLLYYGVEGNREAIPLPEADQIAKENGYPCAERMVGALSPRPIQDQYACYMATVYKNELLSMEPDQKEQLWIAYLAGYISASHDAARAVPINSLRTVKAFILKLSLIAGSAALASIKVHEGKEGA